MRYSSGYLWLLNVPARHRYIYTVTACGVLFFAWFFFWYVPMEKEILKVGQEIKQLKKDGDVCAEQHIVCKKLSDDAVQLQKDVNEICVTSTTISQHFSLLTQYTNDVNLQLISLRAVEQKEHEWYTSAHVVFEALGTLSTIVQFFKLLIDRQMLVRCDEMSLMRQDDEEFLLHCVLRSVIPKAEQSLETKSPSTLRKS